jgi:hypothetical protein
MAKRKRLSPAAPEIFGAGNAAQGRNVPEAGGNILRRPPAPIADVSGDVALRAALDEVSAELTKARSESRFVLRLPLDAVDHTHLVRDRIAMAEDEMESLLASLRTRGQQTPIEVENLGAGRYGLISGWRRLTALRRLADETGEDRFAEVLALVRSPDTAADAYLAMVEENEIRAGLSFYERARIALQAVRQGIHPDAAQSVQALFAAARAPKRSKILSFVTLVEALDSDLHFPVAIPEKLGLALVAALRMDDGFHGELTEALRAAAPQTAEAEWAVLEQSLKRMSRAGQGGRSSAAPEEIAPGISVALRGQRLVLSGPGITGSLAEDLRQWLATRQG